VSTDANGPKAGPLEALLLAIALAERTAEAITPNNEDGASVYVLHARYWLGIVECSELIATELVIASGDNPTKYVVDGD